MAIDKLDRMSAPSVADDTRSTSILVAEDDPITRQLLCRFLRESGHDVLEASDGEQAWELYSKHHPQLVITDWRMPKLDGLGLCRRIRELNEYTFILILTSTSDREAMAQGFEAGADDFMTKPFDRVELSWRLYSGMRVLDLHSALEKRIQQVDEARANVERANAAMKKGLAAAANTQRALLPTTKPAVKQVDCSWSYQPSDHLGGDSLNVFKLDEHRVGFFIVDVCGHGLPSALLAVTLHRVLTPVLDQAGLLTGNSGEDPMKMFCDPGRVLTELNRRFPMKIEKGEYFTAVYCVLDTKNEELAYAGAGHPHPVLLSPGKPPLKLSTEGFPVGFDSDVVYETKVVEFKPKDRVFIYSDGIVEAPNAEKEMFGMERLIEHLEKYADRCVDDAINSMLVAAADWEGTACQEDDVSMIFVEFLGPNPIPSVMDFEQALDKAMTIR